MNILLSVIIIIESGGNPLAFNPHSHARGLMQITPIVLADYNQQMDTDIRPRDLFKPEVNKRIGSWYIRERIPELLAAAHKELNEENVLVAYNAGVRHVGHPLPLETKNYIIKYQRLSAHEK